MALIVIDILILIEFRNVIKRKKRILSNSSSNSNKQEINNEKQSQTQSNANNNNHCYSSLPTTPPPSTTTSSISRVELAERRLTEMVLVKSGVRVIGHMPHFLKHIPCVEVGVCWREAFSVLFIISDTVNFFIYYMYNRVFRAYVNSFNCWCSDEKKRQRPSRSVRSYRKKKTTNGERRASFLPTSNSKDSTTIHVSSKSFNKTTNLVRI